MINFKGEVEGKVLKGVALEGRNPVVNLLSLQIFLF